MSRHPSHWAGGTQKLDSRPISITSTIGQVMECLVTNRIRNEAETYHILSENQADLRRHIEDRLLWLTQSIRDGFQCSSMKRTVLTLINYSRAHGRVWRDAFLLKTQGKGVSPHLIRWIQTRLAKRQSRVTFEGAKSKKTNLKQGVPQSSVQSPLLFIFHIDDLHWGPGDLHVSHFAEDVANITQDSKFHIADKRLQQGQDAETTWSEDWKMLPMVQKSESSFFSTNSHEYKF